VLFRPTFAMKNDGSNIHSSKELLVGVVQVVKPHFSTSRERVSCRFMLSLHVAGKCCTSTREIYPDNIMTLSKINSDDMPSLSLNNMRREIALERMHSMKRGNDCHVDSAELMCSQVKCLDDIILGSRHLVVGKSPLAQKQLDAWETDVMRPSTFGEKTKHTIYVLENALVCTMTKAINMWRLIAKQLSQERIVRASVLIQKHVRGYLQRKALWKSRDKFRQYYVSPSLSNEVTCYKIRTNVFLSTQAKANEWISLLEGSAYVIERVAQVSVHDRMSMAITRWKQAIYQQKIELRRMREEEIFSIL